MGYNARDDEIRDNVTRMRLRVGSATRGAGEASVDLEKMGWSLWRNRFQYRHRTAGQSNTCGRVASQTNAP